MIRAYICDSLDQIVEKNGPPAQNCRPLGQLKKLFKEEKNTFGMHDINPRVQLLPDCRGEHIKLKLLASPSR